MLHKKGDAAASSTVGTFRYPHRHHHPHTDAMDKSAASASDLSNRHDMQPSHYLRDVDSPSITSDGKSVMRLLEPVPLVCAANPTTSEKWKRYF